VAGLTVPHAQSLENERQAFIELASGEIAQNLIRVFFLQERSKSFQPNQINLFERSVRCWWWVPG